MQTKFDITNRLAGGRLRAELRLRRSRDESYTDIAFALRRHGVVVSPETVRRWYLQLQQEDQDG